MKKKALAIFLARGSSKRIKNKNIVNFFSKPIIYYGLKAAQKSKIFSKIHISTESSKIKKVVQKLGFKIDFMRPKSLSGDKVGTMDVLKYVIDEYEKRNEFFDIIFNIVPLSPLIDYRDLLKAYKIFKNNHHDLPLQVFSEYPAPVQWAFVKKKNTFKALKPKFITKISQSFKKSYYESGPFVIFPRKIFNYKKKFSFIDKGFCGYVLPKFRSVDIDDPEDLNLAKVLFKGIKNK